MLGQLNDPSFWILLVPAFVLSIALHEFGHAAVAHALGDPTPKAAGRVTLNPLAHLDLFGTLMVLFAGFGWAKPVPVRPSYFKRPRLGSVLVALAGPGTNLALAVLSLLAYRYGGGPELAQWSQDWFLTMFRLNAILFALNILPIPPLDGGHLLEATLPRRWAAAFQHLVPYGFVALILMALWPFSGPSPLSQLFAFVTKALARLVLG